MTCAGKSAGCTELKKHSLFKRLSAGTRPCREWVAFVSSFFLFHSSRCISSDVRWCNPHKQVELMRNKERRTSYLKIGFNQLNG